jgi:hypothetical protein
MTVLTGWEPLMRDHMNQVQTPSGTPYNHHSEKAGLTAFPCQKADSSTLMRERRSYGKSS